MERRRLWKVGLKRKAVGKSWVVIGIRGRSISSNNFIQYYFSMILSAGMCVWMRKQVCCCTSRPTSKCGSQLLLSV